MIRWILPCLLAVGSAMPAELAKSVTIYRDAYGVPHIYGKTDAAAVFGLMYAQAEDNFWQLEEDYVRIVGRSAELQGSNGLANDILVQAYETEKRAKEQYRRATPQLRAMCDAFAAGINYYLETHPEVKPRLLARFEPWYILANEMRGPPGTGITRAERLNAFPVLEQFPAGVAELERPDDPDEGSNMWAIAPSRTTTGHAMLLINPHVGFFGGGQRYEAHLDSGEGMHVSGFAILGTPYIRSGHNRYLGWSHTNNYARTSDVYVEKFDDPAHPLAYRYAGGFRTAVEWSADICVKAGVGVETRSVRFRKTHHGPVLGLRAQEGLAVRAASAAGGDMLERWAMAKSKNLVEFQAALAQRALTGSNTIYADRAGNIYYLHGNAIPKRSTKFDWTKPVDGSDPETEWQGLHELRDLPQVLNPASGFVQNCNSTPFLTTEGAVNPAAADFPAYMAPEPDTPRSQRSREILRGASRFTFGEWAKAALDTRIGIAAARIPELVAAYRKLQQSDAARAEKIAELVAALEHWDQSGRNDSIPATLFVGMETRANVLRGANPNHPLAQITALEQTKAALEHSFGKWQVAWGEINRLQRVHTSGTLEPFNDEKPSVPVPGAPTFTGTIFTFGVRAAPGAKRSYGTAGDTYVAVVEFARKPVARSLLVFGESANPDSPHFFDQAVLYSSQEFKPAWFELREIRQHAERVYRPGQ